MYSTVPRCWFGRISGVATGGRTTRRQPSFASLHSSPLGRWANSYASTRRSVSRWATLSPVDAAAVSTTPSWSFHGQWRRQYPFPLSKGVFHCRLSLLYDNVCVVQTTMGPRSDN